MEIIENISEKIAINIVKHGNLDEKKKEVLSYGVFNIVQPILSILLTVILGIIFHVTAEILVVSIAASLLRKSSGGAHASSAERCLIAGALIFLFIALGIKYSFIKIPILILFYVLAGFTVLSFYIIFKYSPVDSPSKPIKEEHIENFRKKSIGIFGLFILIAAVFFLISFKERFYLNISSAIVLGLFWQSVTLLKAGEIIIKLFDIFLRKIRV